MNMWTQFQPGDFVQTKMPGCPVMQVMYVNEPKGWVAQFGGYRCGVRCRWWSLDMRVEDGYFHPSNLVRSAP